MFWMRNCKNLSQFFVQRNIIHVSKLNTNAIAAHVSNINNPLVLDLTLGVGNTANKLLSLHDNLRVIGVDCDPKSEDCIDKLSGLFGPRFSGHISKWSNISQILHNEGESNMCDVILIELGPSQGQLKDDSRGFDASKDNALDMRYDQIGDTVEIAQLIKFAEFDDLRKILKTYGGVVKANAVARELVERRYLLDEIRTTKHLTNILKNLHQQVKSIILNIFCWIIRSIFRIDFGLREAVGK